MRKNKKLKKTKKKIQKQPEGEYNPLEDAELMKDYDKDDRVEEGDED